MIDLPHLTCNFGGLANTKSAGINGAEEETKTALTFPPVVTNPAMLHFLPSFPSPSCANLTLFLPTGAVTSAPQYFIRFPKCCLCFSTLSPRCISLLKFLEEAG